MRNVSIVANSLVAAATFLAQLSTAATDDSAEWVVAHYDSLQLVTSRPVAVDPLIAAACTTAVKPERLAGPHAESEISIYVNDLARSALVQSSSFAPGAIVVKLKHRNVGDHRGKEAIGGMIKRGPGYNPSGGDWEYFYQEDDKLKSGPLPGCVQCHADARKGDYVFASWIGNSTLRAPTR